MISNSVTNWPQLLADLIEKRDALTSLIEAVHTHFLPNGAAASAVLKSRRSPKAMKRTDGRTDGAKRAPRQTAHRSLPNMSEKGEAILAALRVKGPQAPGELAKALKIPRPNLAYVIKPLIRSGAVLATGATTQRQFSLPPRSRAAKEAP